LSLEHRLCHFSGILLRAGIEYTSGDLGKREEHERRDCEAEKDQIRAEYRRNLRNSVAFEKRIRDRWREKSKRKNERIAELEAKVEELERRLAQTQSGRP